MASWTAGPPGAGRRSLTTVAYTPSPSEPLTDRARSGFIPPMDAMPTETPPAAATRPTYEPPSLADLGTLLDLTAAGTNIDPT